MSKNWQRWLTFMLFVFGVLVYNPCNTNMFSQEDILLSSDKIEKDKDVDEDDNITEEGVVNDFDLGA